MLNNYNANFIVSLKLNYKAGYENFGESATYSS